MNEAVSEPGTTAERPAEGAPNYRPPPTEAILQHVMQLIDQARPMPLSASSMINKEELLPVLQQALASLPDELRAARWLLKERDEFRARMEKEGEEIIAAARARAEQMVQRTEVARAAEQRARQVVTEAEDRARRLKLETEDWCDQKLGGFEVVLQKTIRSVSSGRQRLQGAAPPQPMKSDPEPADDPDGPFFDQDLG